jgi:hypothetical protein
VETHHWEVAEDTKHGDFDKYAGSQGPVNVFEQNAGLLVRRSVGSAGDDGTRRK